MNVKHAIAALMLALAVFAPAQSDAAAPRLAIVEIENVSQPCRFSWSCPGTVANNFTPTLFPVLTVFHDGSVDLFDIGQRARPELGWLASEGYIAPLIEALRAEHPEAVINMITNAFFDLSLLGLQIEPVARDQRLDPARHRYFSFVAGVGPSDDAFVGNPDPKMYEVFDEDGVYKGPIVVKVHGSAVLDAGVKLNDEQDVLYLHRWYADMDLDADVDEDEVIRPHPGFNGSFGNPEGQPVGILDVPALTCAGTPGLHCFHMDPVAGDFTQPGHVLAVIRVTVGLDGSYGGFWYDPSRSGEGFNVSIFEGNPASMGVAWYTYDPQGNPLYLTGVGEVQHQFAEIEMVATHGGRMASTDNPANVVRTPWGTLRLQFDACHAGRVFYQPLSSDYPTGDYSITRATPRSVGAETACGDFSLQPYTDSVDGRSDNHWRTPDGWGTVLPDPGPSE